MATQPKFIKVNYIFNGNSFEAVFMVYENDKLEKMLPSECIIVNVQEVK